MNRSIWPGVNRTLVFVGSLLTLLAGEAATLPPGQTLYDVTFGGGAFVAVGANGTVFSSVAGGEWNPRISGVTNELRAVAYGSGMFVAAGSNGTLLSSPDGVNWTNRSITASLVMPDIAYGNGRFVVGGKGPVGLWTMLVSTDGITWTSTSIEAPGDAGSPNGMPFGGVTFGAGKFLAVGGTYAANLLLTSTDGSTWKEHGAEGLPGAAKGPLTYGNGHFAMVTEGYYYDDDDDGGGPYQQVYVSEDAASWRYIGPTTYAARALVAADCTYVIAAGYFADGSSVAASRGNLEWSNVTSTAAIFAMAYGNGSFVAVGNDIGTLPIPALPSGFQVLPAANALSVGNYAYLQIGLPCLDPPHPPTSLQWQHNGQSVPGATNFYLSIGPATTNLAGNYTVVASNASGTMATSTVAILTVLVPDAQAPVVGSPTVDTTNYLAIGHNGWIGTSIYGWPPPDFRWYFNGTLLTGETNSYIGLYQLNETAVGNYVVVASNSLGSVTSAVTRVELVTRQPSFIYSTVNTSAREGTRVPLATSYNFDLGAPPARFRTFRNGIDEALPIQPYGFGLIFSRIRMSDAGEYVIRAERGTDWTNAGAFYISVAPGGRLDQWTQRNPLPQNAALFDVTYANGRFVAAGERGAIVSSTDGTNWSSHPLRTEVDLMGVGHGGLNFVSVGGPNILASATGTNWAARLTAPTFNFQAAAFGNGRFVAVAATAMMTSTDGYNNWNDVTLPVTPYREFRDIAFGGVRFVAVGIGYIWISPDGLTWAPLVSGPTGELESVAYANGMFVAVGNEGVIFTSPDGLNWTARNSTVSNRLLGVAFGNGRWVVVGTRGRVLSSANGSTWTREDSGTPDRLEAAAFGNGLFVAVGENGTTLSSPNGATWFKRNGGPTRDLDGISLTDSGVLVVGKGGTVLTSSDGASFVQQNSRVTNDLHGASSGDGMLLAVGEVGLIMTSPDGLQWTVRSSDSVSSLKAATRGNGQWIAVGTQGEIIGSADGATWTPRVSPTANDLNSVAFGNGRFVIVGDNLPPNGTVLTSTDGYTWTRRNQYIGKNLRSVTFANGTFLATANDGLLITSTDGLNWTLHSTFNAVPFAIQNLRAAIYDAGVWVVVGNQGYIASSTDLVYWTRHQIQTTENLHGVVSLAGRLITIGNRGTVLQSDSLPEAPVLSGHTTPGGFALTLSGQAGVTYRIEGTDQLPAPWLPVRTITLSQASTNVLDTSATNISQRFYRAVAP